MNQSTIQPINHSTACCGPVAELSLTSEEADRLAAQFKAMGNPVRLQIVMLLSRYGGQVCVCDIEARFTLSQPTISHHLKILRRAGLIECERRGQWYYYFVNPRAAAALGAVLAQLQPDAGQGEYA
ncbi:MAG: winged helix-turn-helix transcriptional regulator [Caldilineaceae bacterium]|nr:winged helix-turn-helix transcriptional regulator [Caldilineaceae bacterium]MCB9137826.1 winged helix-turn-helix transcriptional regulator [Caldilineaceae bacterium]